MTYCKNYCEEKGISTSKLNEAQKTLYYIAENMKIDKSISEEGYRHFQMAIKALEQEPCDDAISRKAVLNLKQTFYDNAGYETDYVDIEDIKDLPPVYPQPNISEDGTLTVHVKDGSKVSRVLVCGDNHWGGLYYLE